MNVATVLAVLLSALFFSAASAEAGAQGRSNSHVQIIVPYAPGSVADALARIIATELGERLRQPVIVVSKPAGGTVAAAEAFTRADPDGTDLLLVTAAHVIPSSSRTLPYDPIDDFVPVATIASNEFVLVANPSVRASNLQELIALAKERPGGLNFGSAGELSASHLAGALFNARAGVSINHVPYKGAAPALVDLLGAHIDLSYQGPLAVLGLIREGRLKALGYGGDRRSPVLPEVPTFAESGVRDYQLKIWFGLLAPPRTPQAIVERLSADIAEILAEPAIERQLAEQGMETLRSDSRQFAALMKADRDKFAALLSSTDVTLGR